MAKDLTKSFGPKNAVRQIRGPGMNLGLKKPRKGYIAKPKPYKKPRELNGVASGGKVISYLPKF